MNIAGPTLGEMLPSSALNLARAFERIPPEHRPGQLVVSTVLLSACEQRIREALEVPVVDILAAGWAKWLPVMQALEATRESPEATTVVNLLKHEIKATEHPELELTWNGTTTLKLRLDLAITATVHGVALEIRRGSIDGVGLGDVELKLALKYRDHALLPEWSTGRLKSPGRIGRRTHVIPKG